MNIVQKLYKQFTCNLTGRRALAVVLGNIILGFGCALLAYSLMGNEPYTAMNMAMSGGFGMGLGNLRQTIFAIAVTMLPLVLMLVSMKLFVTLLFMLIILGPGAICYGVMCLLLPVFRRYVPGYEAENKEDL